MLRAQSGGRIALRDSFREVAIAGAAADANHAEMTRELTAEEVNGALQVNVMLRMRSTKELEQRVAAGEIVSRAEMAAKYLPTPASYKKVADWLTAQGLTVTTTEGAGHALVSATGSAAQMQQAFQTHFARVKFRGDEFTAAVATPSLPAEIESEVRSIHGLQPYLHPHKAISRRKELTPGTGQPPFLVSDIVKAYDIVASGLTGAGQTIGIVIDELPIDSDLTSFWTANAVPQSLSNIVTVNTTGRSTSPPSGEETLDVSWSSGIASGAQIVIYACGDLNYVSNDYSQILDDLQSGARPNLHQISMSFGGGEETDETPDDMNSTHDMFTAMQAYGVSMFAASGDNGPYGDADHTVQVLYPASDPDVTGVGATTLDLTSADVVFSESGWTPEPDSVYGADNNGCSGGGISTFWARPSWQAGTGVMAGTTRLVPDVAFAGDPNTGCYLVFHGRVEQDGGTSWGTPCWAAMCALINEDRAKQGLPALTGTNPTLYPLLGTSTLRDITTGNNYLYNAGTGYDLVTGIGVPDFNQLAVAVSTPHPAFFTGETPLTNGVYFLQFPATGTVFGYYSYLSDPSYIYHDDLGYEYVFDAKDGQDGVYLYDFASSDFFYTSPTFPFPYLYDFNLKSVLYYYPSTTQTDHYTTNPRYFYDYATSTIITK